MAKPPKAPPASDIEGAKQDEVRNVDAAIAAGQDAGDLERARKESVGRPEQDRDERNPDDRSR
jgi:hypothetical protein